MITKYLLSIVVIFMQIFSLFGQVNVKNIKSNIVYDIDNFPVLEFDSVDSKQIVYYYISTKEKVSGLQYRGGYDAFLAYCDSLYYNREDYNYEELNAKAYFSILFDQEFKIKEVKILKKLAYDNLKYSYDDLVKRILFSTEGRWIKQNDEKDYEFYFVLGYFRLR